MSATRVGSPWALGSGPPDAFGSAPVAGALWPASGRSRAWVRSPKCANLATSVAGSGIRCTGISEPGAIGTWYRDGPRVAGPLELPYRGRLACLWNSMVLSGPGRLSALMAGGGRTSGLRKARRAAWMSILAAAPPLVMGATAGQGWAAGRTSGGGEGLRWVRELAHKEELPPMEETPSSILACGAGWSVLAEAPPLLARVTGRPVPTRFGSESACPTLTFVGSPASSQARAGRSSRAREVLRTGCTAVLSGEARPAWAGLCFHRRRLRGGGTGSARSCGLGASSAGGGGGVGCSLRLTRLAGCRVRAGTARLGPLGGGKHKKRCWHAGRTSASASGTCSATCWPRHGLCTLGNSKLAICQVERVRCEQPAWGCRMKDKGAGSPAEHSGHLGHYYHGHRVVLSLQG
jgi:hypothetical protein